MDTKFRGLPHSKQLNFGGGSDWLGATTAALIMGIIQVGDKNEPLGARGPPLVGEEVRKEHVGKVGIIHDNILLHKCYLYLNGMCWT